MNIRRLLKYRSCDNNSAQLCFLNSIGSNREIIAMAKMFGLLWFGLLCACLSIVISASIHPLSAVSPDRISNTIAAFKDDNSQGHRFLSSANYSNPSDKYVPGAICFIYS